jgi:hypothetical protein
LLTNDGFSCRPDGFKAVCLAEDAGRFSYKNGMDPEAERSSRQIYLTFPATSVFGEQDVRDYFRSVSPADLVL